MSTTLEPVAPATASSRRRIPIPSRHDLRRFFDGWSLARWFLVGYFVLLVVATGAINAWIGQQVEDGIVNRTAAVTGLYIESFIGPHVQSLATASALSSTDTKALNDVLTSTKLGEDVVSFKIWSRDGVILYSPTPGLAGQRFEIDRDLAASYSGAITADITNLTDDENAFERQHWSRLLQMYVPVRETGSGRIIAVVEFYQLPAELDAEVANARLRSTAIVLVAAVASFLLVGLIVKRASDTIGRQQARLRTQVTELSAALREIDTLNARLRRAAGKAVEITTQERRRISGDLHDGPAQAMALGLLQLEALQADAAVASDRRLATAYGAIGDAMTELRQIAAGLRLPDLEPLGISEVVQRAIDDHRRRSGVHIDDEVEQVDADPPLAVKIALFRGLQEALSNATRHGGALDLQVRFSRTADIVRLDVRDGGPGFDLTSVSSSRGLGLAGMRERAALLGGSLEIASAPGRGAVVSLSLPLNPEGYAGRARRAEKET